MRYLSNTLTYKIYIFFLICFLINPTTGWGLQEMAYLLVYMKKFILKGLRNLILEIRRIKKFNEEI